MTEKLCVFQFGLTQLQLNLFASYWIVAWVRTMRAFYVYFNLMCAFPLLAVLLGLLSPTSHQFSFLFRWLLMPETHRFLSSSFDVAWHKAQAHAHTHTDSCWRCWCLLGWNVSVCWRVNHGVHIRINLVRNTRAEPFLNWMSSIDRIVHTHSKRIWEMVHSNRLRS